MVSFLLLVLLTSGRDLNAATKERTQKASLQKLEYRNTHLDQKLEYRYTRFEWSTRGGGQLQFQVVPFGREAFKIIHIRVGSGRTQKNLDLTRQNNLRVFEFVQNLFLGKYKITSRPAKGLTGTWTTVTLSELNGVSTPVSNPTFSDHELDQLLQLLYQFVKDRAQIEDR